MAQCLKYISPFFLCKQLKSHREDDGDGGGRKKGKSRKKAGTAAAAAAAAHKQSIVSNPDSVSYDGATQDGWSVCPDENLRYMAGTRPDSEYMSIYTSMSSLYTTGANADAGAPPGATAATKQKAMLDNEATVRRGTFTQQADPKPLYGGGNDDDDDDESEAETTATSSESTATANNMHEDDSLRYLGLGTVRRENDDEGLQSKHGAVNYSALVKSATSTPVGGGGSMLNPSREPKPWDKNRCESALLSIGGSRGDVSLCRDDSELLFARDDSAR